MAKYLLYCRKSTESEEKQILSIDSQIKELEEFSTRMNLPISEVLTESKSAKAPGRPVFNKLLKKVSSGQYAGIVCWKLDRLARNPIDGSALVWALDQGKIKEIQTPHGSFHNNSNDKFMMQIEFGMAKKYVDDLSDNVKRGLRAKLERGWLPSLPPLGYLNEPKERTIVKDPERFSLIRKAWDLLFAAYSPSRILKILNNELGFRTRQLSTKIGGRPLSLSCLYKIFGNSFYYGLIERGEGVYLGKHDPMITEDEYWKAQEIMGRKGRPRPKKYEFAFTGMMKCGECGSWITAEETINRYGYHYTYYRCSRKKVGVPCRQKSINLKNLEEQILSFLERIQVPQIYLDKAISYLSEKGKQEMPALEDIRRSREKAIADCQRKLENLNQMRLRDLIGDDEYLKEKKALMTEKITLEMNRNSNPQESAAAKTLKKITYAAQAMDRFKNGTLEVKRSVVQESGSDLFLRDKILNIQAEKPLLLIENGLKISQGSFPTIEPRNPGSNPIENGNLALAFDSWGTTVEDVRTFYIEMEEEEARN